ncbi:MAG: hypothetical protein LBT29_08625, partial [Flavobacteriaceae bacterium]|nr:hypothetical protein [Flavobacteriaceae bacterium]
RYLSIVGQTICIDAEIIENKSWYSRFEIFPDVSTTKALLTLKSDASLSEKSGEILLYQFETKEVSYQTQSYFYKKGNGWFLRMEKENAPALLMEISPAENGTFTARLNRSATDETRFAFWLAFNIACAYRKITAIHASTITYNEKSVLFLGESGTGKSTHTRLWLKDIPNTELLNDDSPFLQIDENQKLAVWGSPWSGKTPCYKNKQTPVAGIVRLSQAPHNKIRKLSKIEAIGALLPSCPPALAYDKDLSEKIYEMLSHILQQTPVYHLECLPNTEAAQLVFSTLKKEERI